MLTSTRCQKAKQTTKTFHHIFQTSFFFKTCNLFNLNGAAAMSNNENSSGDGRQVPVATYKCSQCNFYTNHEYYLQQHNLTHGLQALMEHYKRNNQPFDPSSQPYGKTETEIATSKTLHCSECDFQTEHEPFYKQHIQTHHSRQFSYNNREFEDYKHPVEAFGAPMFETDHLKPPGDCVSIKGQQSSTFRCPVNCCAYETRDENELKEHSFSHDLQTPCPEFFKCLKCDFESNQEQDMKIHIKNHETIGPSLILNGESETPQPLKEVFRCNNCDYETNFKAFIKRHMQVHAVKIEIKDELLEKYQCSRCSYETEHEKFLERHKLSHKKSKQFKCVKCKFETLYKRMYLKHLQAHKLKKSTWKLSKTMKCKECSFETSSGEQLDIHKKIKHTVGEIDANLHKCAFCKYQTNWEPCLKRHIEREHDAKTKKEKVAKTEVKHERLDLFKCNNCDFSSKSKHYLVLHLKRSHVKTEPKLKIKSEKKYKTDKARMEKNFECKFRNCTFQTSIKSNYVHHLRKHQSQNPRRIMFHFCDLCDFIAKTEGNLEEHKKKMHLNHLRQFYKCNQCDFKTVFRHSLKTHSIKHKTYTCNVCEEELESAYALVKHRRSHQMNPKNRIYLCDVCGFQSKNDRSLKMHKKTHNPEFKCPDCPFQTHSKVNFQNHCINHKSADEVAMFPCPHCSYQSRLKRNLAWHMKRHVDPSKAQIFKCPSCEYQTFTNAQLKSHLMVHKSKEEVIMLQCDFCTFETKRKSNMVQHRLRHLKDSPDVPLLSCPDCNYTTVAKRHLNKHRKTHNVNPDKMFQCTYCPYKIHRKVYLMRHMENHKTVETYGANDQWQRYTFPPQPQMNITGVTVVPNLGQNLPQHLGHNLM